MILVEIKFGFRSLGGIISLISTGDSIISAKSFGELIFLFLDQIGRVFSLNSYPTNIGYGAGFVLVLLFLAVKNRNKKVQMSWELVIATWLLSHITVVSLGGASTPFLMVGIGPAVSILLGISIYKWWSNKKRLAVVMALALLVYGNLSLIIKENPKGSTLFAIQKDMLLAKQLDAVDYSYIESNGDKFTINSLTSPLWINVVWTYLYKWYGIKTYGYLPEWHGKGQEGQLDSLARYSEGTKKVFLILEPMGGIPTRYLTQTIEDENAFSNIVDERYFGELRIQKRTRK